ncbi:alpha/beta-hydrolase [Xylariomycetidae sp. FL0641]|nr:alpha/beta-hydrolase [Xylariomycetidae sp. FL0641]
MLPLSTFNAGPRPATATALALAAGCLLLEYARRRIAPKAKIIPSPLKRVVPAPASETQRLPYPPDALPGGRDVDTPYGSIRVFEWGPADGARVLFIPGISTPVVALGDLGHDLADRGYRVMLFDLFGRGYSDAPGDLPYDARLYVSQLLLVLASSPLPWTAAPGFHLVGYSLGGGLGVAFARYLPRAVRSLTLVAGGGLVRRRHVGWRSWLYYSSGLLPEALVRWLVRRRIRPSAAAAGGGEAPTLRDGAARATDIMTAEATREVSGDGDANGGKGFNSTMLSKRRPGVTVASVVRWQIDNHPGFLPAFMSSFRCSPIYAPQGDWNVLRDILEAKRDCQANGISTPGLDHGKVHFVLGKDDAVIVKDEIIEDATAVLGRDGVEFTVLPGGHELPMNSSTIVAHAMEQFWSQ